MSPRKPDATSLNPGFSFASFVAGKANQLARAAGLQVADHPTSSTRCSCTAVLGLGKTHLVQAIGNQILARNPAAKIRYIHAETYVSDVVRAYQHKAFDEFKRHYRSLDLLLIDDIQFLRRTRGRLVSLFNTLHRGAKQVVIACDAYSEDMAGIEERLISRFGWGLTVALEPPKLKSRSPSCSRKRIQRHAHGRAGRVFHCPAHPLQRARSWKARSNTYWRTPTSTARRSGFSLAKEALRDLLAVRDRPEHSIDNIQKTVADYYKIRISDMHSKKRSRAVARPRQVAMALAKELTQMSLPEIGSNFGGRDHTTVLHACRQVANPANPCPISTHDCEPSAAGIAQLSDASRRLETGSDR